jgi:hypothetical protein
MNTWKKLRLLHGTRSGVESHYRPMVGISSFGSPIVPGQWKGLLARLRVLAGSGLGVWREIQTTACSCAQTRNAITAAANKVVAARRQENVCRREKRTLRSGHLSTQAPTTRSPQADEYVRMRHQRIKAGMRDFLVTRRLSPQHRQAARMALVATNGNPHKAWQRLKDLELVPSAAGGRFSRRLQSNSPLATVRARRPGGTVDGDPDHMGNCPGRPAAMAAPRKEHSGCGGVATAVQRQQAGNRQQ